MAEPNCYAHLAPSYPRQSSPRACGNFTSPLGYLPVPDYHTDVSVSGKINDFSLHETPGPYSLASTIDEWAELQRGVEFEAAILEHEGPQCLLRREYQFQESEIIGTPLSPQEFNLSQYDTSPPPSTESPDSVLSQDGSVGFSKSQSTDKTTDSSHTSSLKRFKCPDCDYASARQDHVRDHRRVHHLGIYYECNKCHGQWTYKGNFASHFPCNSNGKDPKTQCRICGTTVMKKGLNRHQDTATCRFHHMTHAIAC